MEFRKVPEGLGKGKIQKIKIQLLYANPDPMGTISTSSKNTRRGADLPSAIKTDCPHDLTSTSLLLHSTLSHVWDPLTKLSDSW